MREIVQALQRIPVPELEKLARKLRYEILKMITVAESGHPGGSLSVIDMVLTLYSGEMHFDASNPKWDMRDRFVLSKGHAVPALYAVMAHYGFFPEDELWTLRKLGSPLQGHPANALLPGIEASTGSLGQGLSMAQGMALAARIKAQQAKKSEPLFHVYAILGDGEQQEGQIWEAAMSAAHHKIDNLTVFTDRNLAQIDGLVKDVMSEVSLVDKWSAFGWHVQEIDGHNIGQIREACDKARAEKGRPSMIIANTIKGKGVSFLEKDIVGWHGKALNDAQLEAARLELLGENAHD